MCVLIGWQVCFHSTMKHDINVCFQVVRIYTKLHERKKFYVRASYIVIFFVKSENNYLRTGENAMICFRILPNFHLG